MGWDGVTDAELRAMAPGAFDAFARVAGEVRSTAHPRLVQLARAHIQTLLGTTIDESDLADADQIALRGWPSAPGLSASERVGVATAEQFVLDVGSMTRPQRAALNDALGADAFEFVQVLYALDSAIRVQLAISQVFGVKAPTTSTAPSQTTGLWAALEELMRVIARMDALDPLTTELVRLFGARAHNCRLCKSRRSVVAVDAGADEATFDQIDWYESSDLSDRQKVALRLTDAMLWQPAAFPDALASDVRAAFGPEEALEIVLDVSRNAANKIAVALGADQPNVADGIEYFATDERGELILGVSPG